jgi:hypothetical protein
MTPVAGGVTNGQQDWSALVTCACEGLFTPGIPVDRIVSVLLEVRALGIDKFVRGSLVHGWFPRSSSISETLVYHLILIQIWVTMIFKRGYLGGRLMKLALDNRP